MKIYIAGKGRKSNYKGGILYPDDGKDTRGGVCFFYNENNILIYSEHINLDSPFFKNEYEELSDEMYEKYSLKNWLITMIGKET